MRFWKQYGLLVFSIGTIAIMGIMVYLALDKFIEIISRSSAVIESAGKVMDRSESILSAMGNLCSGGSGFVPAG